jgi:hypothetical protein
MVGNFMGGAAANLEAPMSDSTDEPRRKKSKKSKRRDAGDDAASSEGKPAAPAAPSPLVLIAIIVPLIGFIVFMAVRQARQRSGEQTAFAAEMDKLVSTPAPGPTKATKGKMAIINVDKRELHYLHDRNQGPESDLQAATPAEAATIVQVRVTNRPVLKYLNGREGVKQTFHLTVVDKATWTKVDEKTFEGGDPPESIDLKRGGGTNEPVNGPLPSKEIYAYLRRLVAP